jgi:biotin carboxyl carrier protein
VAVEEGARVEAGQVLVVLEAMKMEHAVNAGASGTVVRLGVDEGDQVVTGQVLVVVEADGEAGGGAGVGGPGGDGTTEEVST